MKIRYPLLFVGLLFAASSNCFAQSAFTKIPTGSIVNDGGSSYGCAWGDYDNDGFIDLVVANGWGQRSFLYRNNGDGTFARILSGPIVEDSGDSVAVVWGDYDNDGFIDLFVSNFDPPTDFLYHNNGNGTFAKITTGLIVTDTRAGVGAAWADYNQDGQLDLFVANSFDQNDFLYRGNGDGTFVSIASGPVVSSGGTSIGCAWGDFDDDGDLDLVVANSHNAQNGSSQNDFLFENEGQGAFAAITSGAVVEDGVRGGSPAWADYDNDGDLDLFVANGFWMDDRLYRNDGGGNLVLETDAIFPDGLFSLGAAWGDYDNDGWLDLFVANWLGGLNRLYRNRRDGSFEVVNDGLVNVDGGVSVGCAWGDYDNDGFLDLFVANTGDDLQTTAPGVQRDNYLYHNNGNTNHWLLVKLAGTASNRSAIGAKVRLRATINGEIFWQLREISGGSGYGSQNDMRAHFGLGNVTSVDLIRIEWPSGTVQEWPNVAVNRILTVNERPVLAALGKTESGEFRLSLQGVPGLAYTIEYALDLTHWLSVTNFTATDRIHLLDIRNTISAPQLFYRAWEGD